MEMCRFSGTNDTEYRKVDSALRRMIGYACKKTREARDLSLNEEQRKMLLDSLRFEQINARQMTIRNAHSKTCKWLLGKPEYLDWLDPTKIEEHHGFLWINGNPGTGKSTLMKFAFANARTKMKGKVVISFFFNARGEALEKSTMGMYQSLLLQLFGRCAELQSSFDMLGLSPASINVSHQWSVESLKMLLEVAIQNLREDSVLCFIDALDECEEKQIRDMISFFQHIGELVASTGISFRVCFSSRHYPHITIGKGLNLVLEGQEGHNQDITDYIASELKIGHSKIADQIRRELQEKASGIFIWVILVIEILNKEHDGGRVHALRRRLQEIPDDLHDLFYNILTRDSHNREELILCVQWVLFAKSPLSPEQLYFAIMSGAEPDALTSWDSQEITPATIKRFILNCSKGLTEMTRSKAPKVQFIHESVRDYLLKEDVLRTVWPKYTDDFRGQSHERLKRCCLDYMLAEPCTQYYLNVELPKASSQEAANVRDAASNAYPFLEYSVRGLLYHAEASAGQGAAQNSFIQTFPLACWLKLDNLFERHEIRRHTNNATLLYILAENNTPNLIKIHPDALLYLEPTEERYGPPLFASLATGSREVVRTFLEAEQRSQPSNSQLQQLSNMCFVDAAGKGKLNRDFKYSKKRTVLSYLAELGEEAVLTFVLRTGIVLPDTKDQGGRTPLSWAAEKGHSAIVKLLLETGEVDVNLESGGGTPLSLAASKGHKAVVELLLETDVDWKYEGQTPLSLAMLNGHEAIVEAFVETGKIDTGSEVRDSRIAFSSAVTHSHEAIVKVLLEMGTVDIEFKDEDGRTPFSNAVHQDNEAIVKLLVGTDKVDVNAKDQFDQTPLSNAVHQDNEAIVKLLVGTDKVDVNAKDQFDQTPLSNAVHQDNEAIVKLLVGTDKVDVNGRGRSYQTPLLDAVNLAHVAIVKILIETDKVDPNLKDGEGTTPLALAVKEGHLEIVRLLLETHKVDVDAKNAYGQTALQIAELRGHLGITRLVRRYSTLY